MAHSTEDIQALEKRIKEGERLRIQAQTKLEGLEEQRKDTEEELRKLGVDPSKTEEEIARLEKEIEQELKEIEALLPSEELSEYKG